MTYSATYSPEDNKLRLSASGRLDKETYARVRAAGFIWAPKQEIFVAPMWTPDREDLALELAGEIDDEDVSLVDRAEQRAERFEDYSDSRTADAERARKAVASIADGIPLGQPILVGHHSERHARRDAEKIENGMRRAVKMWETAAYWKQRAAGAIRHAKYKELPAVRARRIKGLEADQRKTEKRRAEADKFLKTYSDPDAANAVYRNPYNGEKKPLLHALLGTYEGGLSFEDQTKFEKGELSFEDALDKAKRNLTACVRFNERWANHYANRLEYERAMLADAGGIVADRNTPQKGGGCRCWASPTGGWSYIVKVNKVSVTVEDNWNNGGANFTRTIPFDKLKAIMSPAEVAEARQAGRLIESADKTGFYINHTSAPGLLPPVLPAAPEATDAEFEAMKESLRAGVQVVSAPQLFPTPPELAARMVAAAELAPGDEVLEPSAGTGAILEVLREAGAKYFAVEINMQLAGMLAQRFATPEDAAAGICRNVLQADFLEQNGNLGKFDAVIMNPPFADGQDIAHIQHALRFLKPGGRLVAICANGPRQQAKLKPIVDEHGGEWEDLPRDTFKTSGTSVNTAMITLRIPE